MTLPPRPSLSFGDAQGAEGPQLVEPRWTTRDGLLRIRSANHAGHWILELDGELDVSNAGLLDQEIRLAETSAATVTIDLGGLAFMDSSGLRAGLDAQHRSRLNGRLRLRKGSRRVQSVFRLTGTEEALPFEP